MKKRCAALAVVLSLLLAGGAFACGGCGPRGGRTPHEWRYRDGGYYCVGGQGHGSHCRYGY